MRTFNYNGGSGRHLADQDQLICVRRYALEKVDESSFNIYEIRITLENLECVQSVGVQMQPLTFKLVAQLLLWLRIR